MDQYIFESIMALFVAGFAWGFRSWSISIKDSTQQIIRRLEAMALQIHNHRIESTEIFSRLDERVKNLEKSSQ